MDENGKEISLLPIIVMWILINFNDNAPWDLYLRLSSIPENLIGYS